MESLPPEIIQAVLKDVESGFDIASVTQVCRYLHAQAIPRLYRHTTIDLQCLYAQNNALSRSEGPLPPCMEQLKGLSRNSQGQCQYVQRLSIINESDFEIAQRNSTQGIFQFMQDERSGIQFFVNCLLEAAIPFMSCLTEFEWTVLAYPSNTMLAALSKHKLCSFTFQWPGVEYIDELDSLTLGYPSDYDPDIRVLNTENLTSLSLLNIRSNKAADDTADLLFNLRHQLKSLKLNLMKRWRPKIQYDRDSDESRDAAMAYEMACIKDTFFPLIHHFVVADNPKPMELEELELQNMSGDFNMNNWVLAFNFRTIERFGLIQKDYYWDSGAENLWTYLREQKVTFKTLKTDCENEPMDSFLESFYGLESMFFCDVDKRGSNLSHLTLAGHFHSLRKLFYPDNIHGFAFHAHDTLRKIIASCPLLEELGFYILGDSLDATFTVLDESSSLRRLYVTSCTTKEDEYVEYNDEDFVQEFFSYFGAKHSPFFDRLELLSYYRTLWEIVPVEVDASEQEDMEIEYSYEPLHDGELEALYSDQENPERMEIDEGEGTAESTEVELEDCGDHSTRGKAHSCSFRWLLQPECYTWERVRSNFSRMPLRVPWVNYRNDEMARTVHEFVLTKTQRSAFAGLRANPPPRDDWVDNSDAAEDYQLSEEDEDEEEETAL